jgi:phosphoribosylanthranilate isomerase
MLFRIKICGITNVADAHAAAEAGADALGLNFFSKSRRFIDPDAAKQIVQQLPAGIIKVGVFVNHDARQIGDTVTHVGLDAVQLHGDEPPSLVAQIPCNVPIIRAYRCDVNGLTKLVDYFMACRALGRWPAAALIDSDAGADYGGSGELADWTLIRRDRKFLDGTPIVLAGGLTPNNVEVAIATVAPHGVDVASGVESSPGKKDHAKVRDFVAAARDAFGRI